MSALRWEIEASAGPAREALTDGRVQLLVRVRLIDNNLDDGRPEAFIDLPPSDARHLALELLAAAWHAERPTTVASPWERER